MGNARHVRPNRAGDWEVAAPGAKRASDTFKTQSEAVSRARDLVQRSGGGEVIVNNRSGKYVSKNTVGPEPGMQKIARKARKFTR